MKSHTMHGFLILFALWHKTLYWLKVVFSLKAWAPIRETSGNFCLGEERSGMRGKPGGLGRNGLAPIPKDLSHPGILQAGVTPRRTQDREQDPARTPLPPNTQSRSSECAISSRQNALGAPVLSQRISTKWHINQRLQPAGPGQPLPARSVRFVAP